MTINSMSTNSFNIDMNQNKENVDGILQRLAALHSVDNSSPADLISYNMQQSDMLQASQKIQNANESYAMLQISDSGLQQLKENVTELATQSVARNSAALNNDQKSMMDADSRGIMESMRSTVEQTSYNGQQLLSDVNLSSLDPNNAQSISDFSKMLDDKLADVGSAMNATVSQMNQHHAMIEGLANSKQNKEYDVAELMNSYQTEQNKLDASMFARSHSTDFLSRQIGTLLG